MRDGIVCWASCVATGKHMPTKADTLRQRTTKAREHGEIRLKVALQRKLFYRHYGKLLSHKKLFGLFLVEQIIQFQLLAGLPLKRCGCAQSWQRST
jgi:hypothetical protein